MENISVMVWNELSRFVGIEEVVYVRRRGYELDDSINNRTWNAQDSVRRITSGSLAEGLSLPGSDIDTMGVIEDISVSCSDDIFASESDIIMDTNDIKPGFVRLYSHKKMGNHNIISPAMSDTNKGLLLSSLLLRDILVEQSRDEFPDSVGHGPCSTFVLPNKMECDIMCCFECKTWPNVASEWFHRSRNNNWPSRDLITDIVQGGCLVVPIGNPHSKDSHMQWRLSFSIAEKKLVHSFNQTQFLCYALLKLYLKHVINANSDVKDLFCSYFLKTSLFYSMEDEHVVWNKENFLDCFWMCYRRLIKWVRDEYCPNFFIKANNMFEGKICGNKSGILHRYLGDLYHKGVYSLWRIPCLSEFGVCTIDRSLKVGSEISNTEKEYYCDCEMLFHSRFSSVDVNSYLMTLKVIVEMIQTSSNTIDKALLVTRYNREVCYYIQILYKQISTNESNRTRYKQIKGLKSFIVQNCIDMDKCTGMLLLAILCYLCGEYKEVISIAKKVLKKFESCVVYYGLSTIFVYDEQIYIHSLCGKGLTLHDKCARGIFTALYICNIDCGFYPSEIERELVQHSALGQTFINLKVYTYVLLFLSYYHMDCRDNMSDILNALYIVVHDEEIVDGLERPLANALLHRCIQMWESWQDNHREG